MATYYIDPLEGQENASGLRPDRARRSEDGLPVQPGDSILFHRDRLIRGRLHQVDGLPGAPVTYGAYGEGANPVFSGSVDVSSESDWREEAPHIWRCVRPLETEVCNFVFEGKQGAALQWSEQELTQQGDFWDEAFGAQAPAQERRVLLYSVKNPAKIYGHIECVLHVHRFLAGNGHDIIYQDLTFENNGIHAIAGDAQSRRLVIRGCQFRFIGGCVWSREQKIRFGNGIECWNVAEDIRVENCVFHEIYDSAVTHQGAGERCSAADGFVICKNLFIRCGMAAYEQRDVFPANAEFSDNVCAQAGMGFSHLHTDRPRRSEIWPEPMGHHIFLWRIDRETKKGRLKIRRNTFLDAPYGAAIYSRMCLAADRQMEIEDNTYLTQGTPMRQHLFGRDYDEMAVYQKETGKDQNARFFQIPQGG